MCFKQNPRILIWLFTLGGMLLCTLLGATSGVILNLVLRARYDEQNTWQPLPQLILADPKDQLVTIIANDKWYDTIYVRTVAQVVYRCPEISLSEHAEVKCTPLPSGSVPSYIVGQLCEGQRVQPSSPPPGVVVSQVQICPSMPDGWYRESDVLLEDGSLWKWGLGEIESREDIVCLAALGWLLGMILGLGVGIRVYRRRRKELLSLKG